MSWKVENGTVIFWKFCASLENECSSIKDFAILTEVVNLSWNERTAFNTANLNMIFFSWNCVRTSQSVETFNFTVTEKIFREINFSVFLSLERTLPCFDEKKKKEKKSEISFL